jgi:SAM-dependent methyltransferase
MNYTNFKFNTTLVIVLCALLLFIIIVKIHTYFYSKPHIAVEGFEDSSQRYVLKTNINLYDAFYASIYDELVYSTIKNEFEIGKIVASTTPTSESVILDVGSGTGHRTYDFTQRGFNVTGIDQSKDMIDIASKKYPQVKFYVADIMNISGFPFNPATYTHILCLYFTFYYMTDKLKFFQNCYTLLKPGGYLIIHLVDRNQFDPILPPGNPFHIISPQNYTPKRITDTKISFNGFEYTANFNLDKNENIAIFEETFKDTQTNNMRVNKHTMYMDTIPKILSIVKQTGFIIKDRIDMMECAYDYQYLYVLYKPA